MRDFLKSLGSALRRRWKLLAGGLALFGVAMVAGLGYLIGLYSIERHQGYLAPVWDAKGEQVYYLQRETFGFSWGLGWEHFTPPASTYVASDRLSLRRIDPASGRIEVLESFDGSPLVGRVTSHYRGRIFNFISARVAETDTGVEFLVRMNVPRVPSSEQWALSGTWRKNSPTNAQWSDQFAGITSTPDDVLKNDIELMAVRGSETFPAAVIAIAVDGSYRTLIHNDDFERLYPDGIPARQISDRSGRARIERSRELKQVRQALVARHKERGLNDGGATLRAYDDMEELGYLPKSPRLVATPVKEAPADVRIFDIPAEYFRVGLFQDIAAAMAAPRQEVKTSAGTYLRYKNDDLGPRLKEWRRAGNDRFAVRTEGKLYLLEVHRFEERHTR